MALFRLIRLIFSAILILLFLSIIAAPLISASDHSSQLARGIIKVGSFEHWTAQLIVSFGTIPTCIIAEDLSSEENALYHNQESLFSRTHRLVTSAYEVLQERKKECMISKRQRFQSYQRAILESAAVINARIHSAMEAIVDAKDSLTAAECMGVMTLSVFKSLGQAAIQYRASGEFSYSSISKDWTTTSIVTIAMQPMAREFFAHESNNPGLAKAHVIRAKDVVARTIIILSNDLKQHKAQSRLKKRIMFNAARQAILNKALSVSNSIQLAMNNTARAKKAVVLKITTLSDDLKKYEAESTLKSINIVTFMGLKSLGHVALRYRSSGRVSFTLMAIDWARDSITVIAVRPMSQKLAARASSYPDLAKEHIARFKDSVSLAIVTLSNDLKKQKAHVSSLLNDVPNIMVFMELKTALNQVALKSRSVAQHLLTSILTYPRQYGLNNQPSTKSAANASSERLTGIWNWGLKFTHDITARTLVKAKKVLRSVPRGLSTMRSRLNITTHRATSETSDYHMCILFNSSEDLIIWKKALITKHGSTMELDAGCKQHFRVVVKGLVRLENMVPFHLYRLTSRWCVRGKHLRSASDERRSLKHKTLSAACSASFRALTGSISDTTTRIRVIVCIDSGGLASLKCNAFKISHHLVQESCAHVIHLFLDISANMTVAKNHILNAVNEGTFNWAVNLTGKAVPLESLYIGVSMTNIYGIFFFN